MKIAFKPIGYSFLILAATLLACEKENIKPGPTPVKSNKFRIVVDGLSGVTTGLNAVITIQKSVAGEEVISNKKLSLTHNDKYVSEEISLQDGNYKLTKFLVVDNLGKVVYATPLVNSSRAAEVQRPLNIDISLPNPSSLQLPVEVLKVQATDNAESFGYPAGTFNEQQNTPVETFKVKLKASVTVGTINYDSIPANFKIITWDANNVAHEKDTFLNAGAKEIVLPKSHVKFQFKLIKWGVSDEITLTRSQIQEGTTYILGGNKAAKKIKLEETYLFVEGSYQPSGKAIYSYNSSGNLSEVAFYQKMPQHSTLQYTHKNVYLYTGGNVNRINSVEANGTASGFTKFTYNLQGTKVINMHRKSYDQETFAAVEYSYPAGHASITIDYLYSNGNSMEYKMKFVGGNKVEDVARSNNGGEGGSYSYDFNINPYAHMNMPDIYLSNLSKNNLLTQQKGYSGGFPSGDLYKLEYTYDSEGYPVEVIKYYRSYITGQDLYKTKTVFTY